MATSSAGAVLVPTPKSDHGHEVMLAVLGMLAVVALLIAAVLVDPAGDGASSGTPSRTTELTHMPAPAVHRPRPAQAEISR